jgi:hypothetical protein
MGGWTRIGIVTSLVWILLVCGYAGYEFWTFPIPFNLSGISDIRPYVDDAKGFHFVEIQTHAYANELGSGEDHESGLNKFFFVFLTGTTLFGWGFAYSATAAVKWIERGFQRRG